MKHLEHFHELKSLTRKQKFFLLSLLPVYFMVIGLFLQPIQEIGPGIVRLIKEPDFLITDYFVVGVWGGPYQRRRTDAYEHWHHLLYGVWIWTATPSHPAA